MTTIAPTNTSDSAAVARQPSVAPVPEAVRADFLRLGEYLTERWPESPAAAYYMRRDENPDIFAHFGDLIEGKFLLCIRVRDENLYQECREHWDGIYLSNWTRKDLLARVTSATFDGRSEQPWLNLRAGDLQSAIDSDCLPVVLISPSDATLFRFPIGQDEHDDFQNYFFGSDNYRPYREWSQEEIEAAQQSCKGLEWLYDFEPTYAYSLKGNGFKVKNGDVVHVHGNAEYALLNDTTSPLSVTPLGFRADLTSDELCIYPPEGAFDWHWISPEYAAELSGEPPTDGYTLIVVNGSLAQVINNGFSGFVAYEDDHIGELHLPVCKSIRILPPTEYVRNRFLATVRKYPRFLCRQRWKLIPGTLSGRREVVPDDARPSVKQIMSQSRRPRSRARSPLTTNKSGITPRVSAYLHK